MKIIATSQKSIFINVLLLAILIVGANAMISCAGDSQDANSRENIDSPYGYNISPQKTGSVLGNHPVHEHIAWEAAELWRESHGLQDGIFPGDFGDNISSEFYYTAAEEIILGTWQEDNAIDPDIDYYWSCVLGQAFCAHFWNPDLDIGLYWRKQWYSANERAHMLYNQAVNEYEYGAGNDNSLSYIKLGRVAHLLADMGVPAHVHRDIHTGDLIIADYYNDSYEDYMALEYQNYAHDFGSLSVNYDESYSLYTLFYDLAEKADDYDSDDCNTLQEGYMVLPGESDTIGLGNCTAPAGSGDKEILSGTLFQIAEILMPATLENVAGLYEKFWRDTHPFTISNFIVTPSSGSQYTNFGFSLVYTSSVNMAPDANSIKVYINGTPHLMSSADSTYTDGAIYTYSQSGFSPSTYSVYFEAKAGDIITKQSSTSSFTVGTPPAQNISLSANPTTIPANNTTESTITALVLDGGGSPKSGVVVNFSAGFFGGTITTSATTGGDGKAYGFFSAYEVDTATITATTDNGLSDTTTVTTTAPSNMIMEWEVTLYDSQPTYKEYKVDVKVRNPDRTPVPYPVVTFTTDFGTIRPSSTVTGDVNGDAVIYLKSYTTGFATVVANYNGVISTSQVAFQIGSVGGPSGPFKQLASAAGSYDANAPGKMLDWQGNYLAYIASSKPNVYVYDTTTWTQVATLSNPGDSSVYALSLAFSPDGTKLAVGYETYPANNGLIIYSTSNWSVVRQISDNTGWYYSLAWSPDSSKVAAGINYSTTSNRVKVFSASTGSTLWTNTSTDFTDKIFTVSWGASYIAAGDYDYNLKVYNSSGYGTSMSDTLPGRIWSSGWMSSTKLVVSYYNGSDTRKIRTYNVPNTTPSYVSVDYPVPHWVFIDVTPNYIASVSDPGGTGMFKYITSGGVEYFSFGTGPAMCEPALSSDATHPLLAVNEWGTIKIYDPWDASGPSITSYFPADGSQILDSSINVIGAIFDNHGVKTATVKVNGGGAINLTLDANGNFSQAVTLVSGISNSLLFEATDWNNNSSSKTVNVEVLVDNVPPQIFNAGVSPAAVEKGGIVTITANISDPWSGLDTATPTAHIQAPDENDTAALLMYDDGTNGDVVAGNGVYTCQWNTGTAAEGSYYLDITALDNELNLGEANNAKTIQVNTLPSISGIQYLPASPANLDNVQISAAVTDESGVSSVILYYSTNGGASYNLLNMVYNAVSVKYEATLPQLDQCTVQFYIRAQDMRLNLATSGTSSFGISDKSPPSFYGWTLNPSNLTEDSTGNFTISVNILDTGGSGLSGKIPQLSYKRGNADGAFTAYQDMTDQGSGKWSFIIPEPAATWDIIEGQEVGYQVQVSDVAGNLANSGERKELVDNINHTPIISSSSITTATEGVPYSYDVEASDIDDEDTLVYSLLAAPIGMTIDPSSGVISWAPGYIDAQVEVQVSDGKGGIATQFFTIKVTFANSDNDHLPDTWEIQYFGNLTKTAIDDPDSDLLTNLEEFYDQTDPSIDNQTLTDTDGDKMPDVYELAMGLQANTVDASGDLDNDGFANLIEYLNGTPPVIGNSTLDDTDGDGMPDQWEWSVGLDAGVNDAADDADNDGFPNYVEYLNGTNPLWDNPSIYTNTDSDLIPDLWENAYGLDPGVSNSGADNDADGFADLIEYLNGTNPNVSNSALPDGDADDMPDQWETAFGLNPLAGDSTNDSDGDNISNLAEYKSGSDPLVDNSLYPDANSNGLPDYWETAWGISDANADPDGDDLTNIAEYANGLNPLISDVPPPYTITVSPTSVAIRVGQSIQFGATGTVWPVVWSVSDINICSIDSNGLFFGNAAGTCTVIATDSKYITGTATATVQKKPKPKPPDCPGGCSGCMVSSGHENLDMVRYQAGIYALPVLLGVYLRLRNRRRSAR